MSIDDDTAEAMTDWADWDRKRRKEEAVEPGDFYKEVHSTIGSMNEWERGYYFGLVNTLFWCSGHSQEQVYKVSFTDIFEANEAGMPLITKYSPSGDHKGAPHFYSDPDLAEDTVEIYFDPKKFQATWAELDSEAAIVYYRLYIEEGKIFKYLTVEIASTESDDGLPEDWDVWPGEWLGTKREEV